MVNLSKNIKINDIRTNFSESNVEKESGILLISIFLIKGALSVISIFLIKGALSGLRQLLETESSIKMIKNAFYCTFKSSFCSQDI